MKRIIGVVLALILVSMPFTSSVMTIEEEQPEYYEVTGYNMRGLTYDKETIRISYKDAMAMKQELEYLESLPIDSYEMNSRRYDVFIKYNLLADNDINRHSSWDIKNRNTMVNNLKKQDYTDVTYLFFSFIEGTIGPSFINILNLFSVAGPFFSIAKGIDVDIKHFTGSSSLKSDSLLTIFFVVALGRILILPFFSPTGYIDAFVGLGLIEVFE